MAWKHAFDDLRTGAWLTRERLRFWVFALLTASLAGLAILIATSDGRNDAFNRPLGTDFSNFYAAGTAVLEGHPERPFDSAAHHARQNELFGPDTPFYGWPYPPFFLFVAAALATMPYQLALAVWQAATLALYLWSMRMLVATVSERPGTVAAEEKENKNDGAASDRPWCDPLFLGLVLAYPAVFVNLGHGHNGFLTAALMGGALALLDRRPWLAGVLFGMLAYKPQFGLMIPLVLLVTGRWRVIAGAAATVAALIVAATLCFGVEVWTAFLDGARFTQAVVLEAGNTGWHKIQSVFAVARMWGGSVPLAYAVQAGATVAVAAGLVRLWRSRAAFALKAAALPIAALLATPYSLDYDLMVLAPAIAFLAAYGLAHGFRPWEASALAALWLVPLAARSVAELALLPLAMPAMLCVLVLILRRAAAEAGSPRRGALLQGR